MWMWMNKWQFHQQFLDFVSTVCKRPKKICSSEILLEHMLLSYDLTLRKTPVLPYVLHENLDSITETANSNIDHLKATILVKWTWSCLHKRFQWSKNSPPMPRLTFFGCVSSLNWSKRRKTSEMGIGSMFWKNDFDMTWLV